MFEILKVLKSKLVMYLNFISDRKSLGYEVLNDTSCGMKLVSITNSTLLLIRTSNVKDKTKRLIIVISLGTVVYFSGLESAEDIGLSLPPTPVVRVEPSLQHRLKKPEITKQVPRKPDRISYKYFSKSKEELFLLIYATDPRLGSNQQIFKLLKELREGSWGLIGTAAFLGLIILIFSMGEGFVPNIQNPGWGLRNNLYEPPGLVRPADCETQLYAGSPEQSLKTEASPNQPNAKDRWILVESRPELRIRRGQAQFKMKYHGALAGLSNLDN
jgi:hypothetical protein